MRAVIPARRTALPVAANTLRENTGPAQRFLAPLLRLVETSDSLIAGSVGAFSLGETRFHIPRLIFMGPRGGGDTVRLGIFAGLHGDDHTGPEAIGAFTSTPIRYAIHPASPAASVTTRPGRI
jgi:hypothetical protein